MTQTLQSIPARATPLMRLRLKLYPHRRYFKWLRRVAQWQMKFSIADAQQWRFCRWVSMLTTAPGERVMWRMPNTSLVLSLDLLETIQMSLYYRNGFHPEIGHWVRQSLKPDAIFIDAGANVGIQSLLAADYYRAALSNTTQPMVYAFEPNPAIYAQLVENIRLNHLENFLYALPHAVSDRQASMQFFLSSAGNSASSSLAALGPGHLHTGQAVTIETVALDDFVARAANNRRVGLLKLDIEGAELLALRGAQEILKRDHPTIIMEVYPTLMNAFGYAYADARDFLKTFGYEIQRIMPDGTLTRLQNDEWSPNVAYGDVLCAYGRA